MRFIRLPSLRFFASENAKHSTHAIPGEDCQPAQGIHVDADVLGGCAVSSTPNHSAMKELLGDASSQNCGAMLAALFATVLLSGSYIAWMYGQTVLAVLMPVAAAAFAAVTLYLALQVRRTEASILSQYELSEIAGLNAEAAYEASEKELQRVRDGLGEARGTIDKLRQHVSTMAEDYKKLMESHKVVRDFAIERLEAAGLISGDEDIIAPPTNVFDIDKFRGKH
jgi:hypothetical protein